MMGKLGKIISYVKYAVFLTVVFAVSDVVILNHLFGYGYPRDYKEENLFRYPAPYVTFTGRPNSLDHNEFGFRGKSLKDAKPDDFKVAFFGGSTGYYGDPPIAETVENELSKILGSGVFVANYSVVSSNHRQHLHGIIENFSQLKPDLIIFYGGYNETVSNGIYDPRPGYPYNFFYRAETSPAKKLVMENSAVLGELDKLLGLLSGISRLRDEQQPFSDDWNNRIVDKYFETLDLALDVSGTIESSKCGNTRFIAFYQPYVVPNNFRDPHENIRRRLDHREYGFDVSSEFEVFGLGIFSDPVHVQQEASNRMGERIAQIVAEAFRSELLSDCRAPIERASGHSGAVTGPPA